MFKVVYLKVNIQIRPIQMIAMKQLNILYGTQCPVPKIRVLLIAQKIFLFSYIEPDAKRRYVFNAC